MTRILIIEDEEKVRRMYSAMLKNEGFDVMEAPDAIQASCILNKEPVDIMLLDINMPQVYGSMFYEIMQNWFLFVSFSCFQEEEFLLRLD